MIAAIYARKSTDQNGVGEEAKSVTRQIEHARAYAAKKGWAVAAEQPYSDDGISGAEFKNRPGLLRLLNALAPRPPFQVLIMSEESRLGREAIETGYVLKQIVDAGVRVFFYLEDRERKLDTAMDKVMLSLTNFASEMEREKAQQRNYDAARTRAEAGAVTGGRVFGYTNQRQGNGFVRRVINEAEAVTVRRIFTMYAEGAGLTRIAKKLNEECVPAPPPSHNARPINGTQTWAGTAIRDILRRPLYTGVVVWNKTQKLTRGGNTKLRRWRPESEWLTREVPELRIVDEELWQRVQARREAQAKVYLRQMKGGRTLVEGKEKPAGGRLIGSPSGADVESPYLLSGIARCAECGGSLVAMTRSHGKRRVSFYGCLRFHKRGSRACRNGLQIRQAVLDSAVLDVLAQKLDADVIAEAVRAAVADLSANQADLATRRVAIAAELGQITTRERRLLDSLVDGDGDAAAASIRGRLREELARRDALTTELAHLESLPAIDVEALAQDVAGRAADLRAALGRNIPQARQVVRQLLEGRLVCAPFDDGKEHGYTFKATGTYRRLGVPALDTLVNVYGGPNGIW